MYEIKSLFPTIPLIKINLVLIGRVLPFNKNLIRKAMQLSSGFLQFLNASHLRLILIILENLYENIPIDLLLAQLMDLQKYLKALFLIEHSARARIKS